MMYPYVSGYIVYFWSNEEGELIHVHVSRQNLPGMMKSLISSHKPRF